MSSGLVIRSDRVLTPEGVRPASMHIRDGVIVEIAPRDSRAFGRRAFDAGHSVVIPGLVDTHVHINEPGRTAWEGFRTATRAAAAGGVTTLVDMPLNSTPATTTLEALETKRKAARGKCWVDVGFWGGVVPGNTPQLRRLYNAGVMGFKCFLIASGVDEFPHVSEPDLRGALEELRGLKALLIVHAELPGPVEKAMQAQASGNASDPRRYSTFLRSRPREAENEAIALLIRLARTMHARDSDLRLHIVHHSSADALDALRNARAEGLPITVETCPHYLYFAAEEIPDAAAQFKCCPPIRERENCEQLWAALHEGLIEMVVSDHSPCPPAMKLKRAGDFLRAWGGISSLQLRLPVIWTAARERGYSLQRVADWLSAAPARLIGLHKHKGAIRPGADADLVIWNPEARFRVKSAMLHHRHKLTPYVGRILNGVVEATFLRGEKIYVRGRFSSKPRGRLLKRED